MTTPDPLNWLSQGTVQPPCPHQHFHVHANVEVDTRKVYINVVCKQCGQPMIFPGVGERGMLQGSFV